MIVALIAAYFALRNIFRFITRKKPRKFLGFFIRIIRIPGQ